MRLPMQDYCQWHSLGILSVVVLLLCFGHLCQAQEMTIGRSLVAGCFTCHGDGGHSQDKTIPSLAGWKESALFERLMAYQRSNQSAEIMVQLAKGYSESQLRAIAHSVQSLKP